MPGMTKLVGMAEIYVLKASGTLQCLGLGSCIGLAVMDPSLKICGMVHIMLPEHFADKPVDKPGKFADTGIKALLEQMQREGADMRRLVMCYGGGAQVFKFGAGTEPKLDVGARNIVAVENHLRKLGAKVVGKDVGGTQGRTMLVNVETGEVRVRTVDSAERTLCQLARVAA